jgi:hypothetical protein
MREPDYTGKLERDSRLLAWTRTPRYVAEQLGRMTGDVELEGRAHESADELEQLAAELDLTVRVWDVAHTPEAVAAGPPAAEAGLGTWLVNGPFHPFWNWWMLGVVHLRPIEGMADPPKRYPEAEYELMIVSLNPGRGEPDVDAIERGEDWGDLDAPKFLTPPDLVFHFHGVTDEMARDIGEAAARAIASGHLSPDSDWRNLWIQSLRGTVAHFIEGVH